VVGTGRPGKLTGTAAAAFNPEVEAAVLAHYGREPLDGSLRRLYVMVSHLPPGALPASETAVSWSVEAHLLAGVLDAVRYDTWAAVAMNTPKGKPRPKQPDPVPRPGDQAAEPPSWFDLAKMMG